jgi:phosphoenolpyruvate carboxykinase (ATP)
VSAEHPFVDPRELVRQAGVQPSGIVLRNPGVHALYDLAVQAGQATVLANGALRQDTSPYFGRAARSSFYVRDPSIQVEGRGLDELIAWGNPAAHAFDNMPIPLATWDKLLARVKEHLSDADRLFVNDGWSGRTARTRLPVRVITDRAVGALFAHNIFLRPDRDELIGFEPGWTLLHAPDVQADAEDRTNGEAFILTHLGLGMTIVGGTRYNGQIKKAIFAVQNLRLPLKGILTMHAGASEGDSGRCAIHAGLSGTGKTTLSNTGHPVADDQIVVDIEDEPDRVITNMEGGQYAKTENLRRDKEPEVYDAIRYGTTAENLKVGPDGHPDFSDSSITANGRVGYPLEYVPTAKASGASKAPDCITFLTADGFGVLPPLSRLSTPAAMAHFALGFTSKMPGTEKHITEPVPTFSAFFGLPFMPLKPRYYTDLLARVIEHGATQVWLVNTGWLGPARPGRKRVDILVSKAIINAVRDGHVDLSEDNFTYDARFRLEVPREVPGVDPQLLDPRNAWEDSAAYEETADKLAAIFAGQAATMDLPPEVRAAVPEPLRRRDDPAR